MLYEVEEEDVPFLEKGASWETNLFRRGVKQEEGLSPEKEGGKHACTQVRWIWEDLFSLCPDLYPEYPETPALEQGNPFHAQISLLGSDQGHGAGDSSDSRQQ